jgi:hypothetical protein
VLTDGAGDAVAISDAVSVGKTELTDRGWSSLESPQANPRAAIKQDWQNPES